ncbi:hypothetical protein BDV10DRAFT_165962 [Aspergillus recurvatus]
MPVMQDADASPLCPIRSTRKSTLPGDGIHAANRVRKLMGAILDSYSAAIERFSRLAPGDGVDLHSSTISGAVDSQTALDVRST